MSLLPDFDHIPSIVDAPGRYRLERWPYNIEDQIVFLLQVREKWGPKASFSLTLPYEGYPGFIDCVDSRQSMTSECHPTTITASTVLRMK